MSPTSGGRCIEGLSKIDSFADVFQVNTTGYEGLLVASPSSIVLTVPPGQRICASVIAKAAELCRRLVLLSRLDRWRAVLL